MNSFFKKLFKPTPPPKKVELLSVHIPKTAGTSFRNILKEVYGDEQVVRLDINPSQKHLVLDEVHLKSNILPNHISVLHGHYRPVELYEMLPHLKDVPAITWLRHPVKRVISNYYYLVQQINEALVLVGKKPGKWTRMQRTLLEYAADPVNQNRMSFFLEGKNIDDYLFVGIMEDYDNDMQRLAKILNWNKVPVIESNVTRKKESVTDAETLALLEKYNSKDMELYNYIVNKKKNLTHTVTQ